MLYHATLILRRSYLEIIQGDIDCCKDNICITQSLCYTAEINTALKINYTSVIQKKKKKAIMRSAERVFSSNQVFPVVIFPVIVIHCNRQGVDLIGTTNFIELRVIFFYLILGETDEYIYVTYYQIPPIFPEFYNTLIKKLTKISINSIALNV